MEFVGGSKNAELQRSAEMYVAICEEQSPLMALWFIYDSQHDLPDIKRICEIIDERKLMEYHK